MTSTWRVQSSGLKFLVGEKSLGTVRFPTLVASTHFTKLSGEPPLPSEFPDRFQVVRIPSCPVDQRLPRITLLPHAIQYVVAHYHQYYIDMNQSFDQYLTHFSGKTRSTLKRKVRKFAEACQGQVDFREFREPTQMPEFHDLARAVSAKTYQERLLHSGLPQGEVFRKQLEEWAGRDAVRGYLLFYRGQPISYLLCPIEEGVVFYSYVGYDSEYEQWSPGTVLLYLALEKLFSENRFKVFDFTEGEGAHKESFANHRVFCAHILYLRRDFRFLALVYLHSALYYCGYRLKCLLAKLGLKDRIKIALRRRA